LLRADRIAKEAAQVKFLHAADIHLDSPLAGLSRRAVVPAHVTQDCTRRAFANLVDLAIAEDVAFVIIAGDLYDADWRDFSTGLFFAGEMRRLGRPCVLVRGNHDAASVITRSLVPPDNVRIFSARKAETFLLPELGVAIHGQSFPNRAVPENLSDHYPAAVVGMVNIGVLHTSGEDPGEHETYAPCSINSLIVKGYDYWALGHIHQRRVLHENPWVVFPGNTQGRNPRETGAKGASIVELSDRRIVDVTHKAIDVLRWGAVTVDVAGADGLAEFSLRCRFALAEAFGVAEGRPLIARVTVKGATALNAGLLADPASIDAECRNAAAAISGDLFIERVRIETTSARASLGVDDDAIAQLAGPFLAALDDLDVQSQLLEEFKALAAQIPRLPGRPAPDLPQTLEALRVLAPDAWQSVAFALAGGPSR
jgi:DNA repair exonuclease SbcCD nuclease subunit